MVTEDIVKPARYAMDASPQVRAALAALGRTEDVRFSPDNSLLCLAGFERRRLLLLRVRIASDGPVRIDDFLELSSDAIGAAHGIDFIDDATLVVANRDGRVAVLALPQHWPADQICHVEPVLDLRRSVSFKIRSPGSVAVRRHSFGLVSLYVCQNYAHRVSRHLLAPRFGFAQLWNSVALRRGLDIPDGIAISPDQRWIAVSSHGTGDVKIFDASRALGSSTEPAGLLSGVSYPHGVRFAPDGRHIVVADAGRPVLQIYRGDGGWQGEHRPARTAAVLDAASFRRGQASEEEGGPKGLDIDRSGTVVAITCAEEPLSFFPLPGLLGEDAGRQEERLRTTDGAATGQ